MNEETLTDQCLSHYFSDLTRLLAEVDQKAVGRIVDTLFEAWQSGRRVLLAGNGGSSSSVSHIVADLQKNIYLASGVALKTLCLADSAPLVTAWANDTDYANIFAPQVHCWGEPGDVLLLVSGSGNSPNILHCAQAGRDKGMVVIGLSGFAGGKLQDFVDEGLVVRSDNMQRIEDVHMSILHGVYLALVGKVSAQCNPIDRAVSSGADVAE